MAGEQRDAASFVDGVAEQAMAALRGDDPVKAARLLREILQKAPGRLDLVHALAVTELRMGDAREALETARKGIVEAERLRDETASMMMPQLKLVEASAAEDLGDPAAALAAYDEILVHEPEQPRARQGRGHVLLAWGRVTEGLQALDAYIEDKADEPPFLQAAELFVDEVRRFVRDDIHPKEFLAAHRGSYVEMFDHYAEKMGKEGWIAEAARMMRDDDGKVVPIIPEGAAPYAAVRVDLVNPQSGQPGRIADQPMVVALADYPAVAQAPVVMTWPAGDWPFVVSICSQVPWNDLTVVVVPHGDPEVAARAIDAVVGDWYTAGFDGAFGSHDAGRLHEISDLEVGPAGVRFSVDCGRAALGAVDDLLRRLTVLHATQPLRCVHLGRGYPPAGA